MRGAEATDDRLDHRPGSSARRRRDPEKRGGAAQAIGRSRGGLTTKVIAVACDEDGFVAVDIAEGQRHDAKLAAPMLAEAKAAVGTVDEVLGDKGFDSDAARGVIIEELDVLPVNPHRKNRKESRP